MRTDKQLRQDVAEALAWDPGIRHNDIAVAARDGVVSLSGFVDSHAEKARVERLVEKIAGVKSLADGLRVKMPLGTQRSDTDIAHEVVRAFRANRQVPTARVTTRVEDGWVTLNGDVEWYYQSLCAERVVRTLPGVRGVTNLLRVRPPHVAIPGVSQVIRNALRRNAELSAERVRVEVRDGHVTLRGTVRSLAERRDAEHAAWSAPGVTSVDDQLDVSR